MKRRQLSIFSITLPTTSLVFYFSISSSIIFLSFVLIWANKSSPSNIPLPAQQTTNCLEYFNTSSIVFGFTPSPLAAAVPPLPAADHPTNLTTGDDFIDTNNVSVTESSPSKDLSVLKLTDAPSSTPENASSSYFENEAQAVAVLQHELHDDEDEKEEEEEEEEEDSGGSELDIIFANNFTAVAQQIPPAAILIDKIETNTHEDQNVPSVNTTVEQNAPLNRTREEQTAPLTNTTEEQNAPLMNKTEEQNAPVNRTREEQTAPLTNTTEEQNAPLMNKTEEQNALILMNKAEEKNAAALSEKTVQAKTRKKKKARATSFDQMTQISSSGPQLVEEDKKIAKLGGCDFSTRGRWVEDESYPLYTSRSCPFIEEGFSCNGRLDKNFTKWRWQPQDCDIPRFDARKMLEFIRGKRLVFVGDSINHNQWASMVCMLVGDKRNPNKPRFIRERSYSVVFVDYKCKVQFYPSVFLVEKVMTRVNQKLEQTSLRIDSIDRGSHRWREADILVFDTEHWWVDFKTNAGVNFFQEGDKIHPHLDVLTALRKGLMTWASWVDHYINPRKTQVFFRTSSPTHFSGGKWNLPQSCVGVSEPLLKPSGIVNEKDVILEEVLKQMKTRVTLLNTTILSEYRMDAHPSDIRDCSHWCLPGIPDVWNELLYLHLRVSESVGAQNDLHVKNEDGGASESDIFTNVTVVPAQSAPAATLFDKIENQNAPLVNTTKEQNEPTSLMNKADQEQNAAALSEKTVQVKSKKKKKKARATSFDQMTQISSSGPLLVEEDKKIGKLGGCDFSTRGRWVEDESYPLYTSRSCPFIEEGFSCNGRLDKNYTKWRWQPQDCDIPRFDARKMLEFIRGKRLVFVGDSINKNQWQSMVCMLVGDKRNPNKPRFIRERSYSVVFVDYKCKVEFYPSVFLVEQVMTRVDHKLEQTSLRIDSIDRGSLRWREADILVFNTEHWWVDFKTNAGVNFFQEGDKIHPHLDVLTALRKGLMTWASWVDHYINPRKTQVFFRTSSPTHFSGGKWNLPQSCVGVSEPLLQPSGIVNEKDVILEEVLKQMKTRVTLLNTTSLSEYRMDAHPSDIRDCSHWCLPGIPDVWNELLYLHLRVSEAVGAQNDLHVKNEDGGASESDIFTNVTVVPAQSAPAATLFDKIENQNAPLVNTTKEQNEPTSLMNKADQDQNAAALSEKTVQVKSKNKKKKKARATSFDQMTQISSSGPLLVEEDKKIGKLGGCDFSTRGRWVEDESYPLYTSRSCPFIEEGFSCNGRLDKKYTKWRWQPQDCDIPRFDARKMLEFIRGKRLVFVGDSINKNQWQSMVCMLVGDKRNPNKPRFIRERSYSVVFVDYKCKVEFYPSVFLVEQVMTRVDQKLEQTSLRIDSIDRGSHRWREADVLVFNTEHWWVDFKTNAGVNFFQEGDKIHPHLDVLTALRKGLMTWASWVDHYINPRKTQVFFRTSSPTHFSGGKWKLPQSCVGVSEPLLQPSGIVNEKDVILEEVLKQMTTRVTLLNTTSLSEYRMDAHPSDIRDCSHWCLPGIPDVWNELLYLHLRVSEAVGAQNDLHVKNEDGGASESDIFTNVTVVPAQSAPAATLFDKIENQNAPLVNTTKEQNEPTSLMNKTDQEQSAPISVNRTDKEQTAALMNKIERASEAQNAPILMNKADQEQNPPTLMNRATDEQNAALVEKPIKKRMAGKKKKKKKSIATSVDQKSSTTQISSGGGMQNIEENKKRTTKLGECDFSTRGRWVYDESYPLYTRRSCPFIYEGFDCQGNGRIDKNFTRWRWQPQYCEIPRFDATKMLELMRGKRLLYVGDSINRNQFQSMVCMLMGDIRDPNRPRISHAKGTYSFYFVDYKFTVEFSPSVFLVEKGTKRVGQKQEQTSLRIDTIDQGSSRWRGADILVFDTEHWWTDSKTNSGKNFYQEGGKIHPFLDVYTALRKGLMTWAAWVDKSINPLKTQVFFRTSSPTHFSGGEWKSGRSCIGATEPLPRPSGMANKKDVVLEEVVKQMKTHVTLLNITSMSEYRIDAHPSAIKDCSHWCLPGLPDAWNELLFLHLLGDS